MVNRMSAEIDSDCWLQATVSIIDAVSSEQAFTSPPVVLSLNEDGSVLNHTMRLNRGYPAICITVSKVTVGAYYGVPHGPGGGFRKF